VFLSFVPPSATPKYRPFEHFLAASRERAACFGFTQEAAWFRNGAQTKPWQNRIQGLPAVHGTSRFQCVAESGLRSLHSSEVRRNLGHGFWGSTRMKQAARRENKLIQRKLNIRNFTRSKNRRFTRVDAFFRHPMTLLLIGFVLTGVIGSGISYRKQTSDSAAAAYAARAEHFRSSLDLYESYLSSWEVRAVNLDDAVSNSLPSDEIEKAMEEYIKAYIAVYGSIEQVTSAAIQFMPSQGAQETNRVATFISIAISGLVKFDVSIVEANDCLRSMYLKTKTHSTIYEGPCQQYSSHVQGDIVSNEGFRSYNPCRYTEMSASPSSRNKRMISAAI
jgi:hypothetical protein